MKLIGIIYLSKITVFKESTVIILDKTYEITLDKDFPPKYSEYDEQMLDNITVTKNGTDKFKEIRDYVYGENNIQINWIVGDNWSWKTTILDSIGISAIGRPIKRNYTKNQVGIQYLVQKKEGIIYIFETLGKDIKSESKLDIKVGLVDIKNISSLHSLILWKREVLKNIFTNVLKINNYNFWISRHQLPSAILISDRQ